MAGTKLKPCPFCGGEARRVGYRYASDKIVCQDCEASVPDIYAYTHDGEYLWNKRYEKTCSVTLFGRCSECRYELSNDLNYCPNCGAKVVRA